VICVIADDLSGAAELGGVALRYGMAVEVQREFHPTSALDLICVDTDSRSCRAEEAARRVAKVADLCRRAAIERVFKKVDSVLRGHVAVELGAMLNSLDKSKTLLVPANPSLGRTTRDGHYWVDGSPLHRTGFAQDPEYPLSDSSLPALLGTGGDWPISLLRPGDPLPSRGILVGQAAEPAEVTGWAKKLNRTTVPAGAADFFHAFLAELGWRQVEEPRQEGEPEAYGPALFVCGSISDQTRSFCLQAEARGWPVLRMPDNLFRGGSETDPSATAAQAAAWADATCVALRQQGRAVVAIDRPPVRESGLPQRLGLHIGALVARVLDRCPVNHIHAEGGATASALVRQLGWRHLRVDRELAPGVVRMRIQTASDLWLTIKPGSYPWPAQVTGQW
jgi:uncharacterized protein YgbK (DUF1537 family)